MMAATRFKLYKKSGGRIYIPQKLLSNSDFPFIDEDILKITIEDGKLILAKAMWWEMINWDEMGNAFEELPQEIKDKIQASGLKPS